MAQKKFRKTKKFTKKGKKGKKTGALYRVASSYAPFPLIQFAKLTYVQEFTLNPSSSTPVYQIFRANSLYDPDYTGAGSQPMGFDQFTTLYNHYEVYGSRIELQIVPNGNNGYFGITIDDDATLTTSLTDAMTQRGTRWKAVPNSASSIIKVYNSYSQVKAFGKSSRGTDNQKAQYNANPGEQQFFMCWCAGVNNADPAQFSCIARVTYFAKFSELKTLAGS